tara:strand:- start:712 stop:1659 length:948 start_codon:yes stop_codon:yes gene_type:complete
MKGELFDVSFNPLTCVLKKPLHMAQDIYDIKHQVKRCLLEIKDWADRDVFLSWSGGFDGAFTVLAFLDLVDEGKLPIDAFQIKGAHFQSKGRSASSDWDRGVKFLQEIQRPGMRIDLQDIELDKTFMKKAVDVCFEFDQGIFGWAIQEAWRRDQDNICLLHMGFPFPTYKKDVLVEFNTFNFCEVMDNSENVNIYQWDEHIFSSFFTDFLLEIPYVDYNPDHHYDEYLWWSMSSQVHKFIYFLMCYPILMKLFLKNLTVKSWLIDDEDIKMLWQKGQQRIRFQVTKEHGHCEVILPNGEVVKSIEHSQQFFNGHS